MEDPPPKTPTTPTDPRSLLDLPDKCLTLVLQLLDKQGERRSLRRLAKTNSRLYALALPIQSATLAVSINIRKQLKSVYRYLKRHGQMVNQLHLQGHASEWECGDNGSYGLCSLGAPQVKELPTGTTPSALSIQYLCVNASSLLTGALATNLQELDLSDCLLTNGESLEAGLVSLAPSLRGLRINRLWEHRGFLQLYSVPFPNAALPSLTALTRLQLGASVRSTEHLSSLVELRVLSIQSDGGIDIAAADLPGSGKLTYLALQNPIGSGPEDGPTMSPAVLSHVGTQLRHLELKTYMAPDQGGTAALLQELGKLTQLTMLALLDGPLAQPLEATGTAPAGTAAADAFSAYASITASSSLQVLWIHGANMPDGAWKHVFGPSKQLPQLSSLKLGKDRWSGGYGSHGVSEQVYKSGRMTAADIAALASTCPTSLTSLVFEGVQEPDASLQPLLQRLTGIKHLNLSDAGDADAPALSQLSGLQHLALRDCSFSNDSVARLTVLTQLESFWMRPKEGASGRSGSLDGFRRFKNKAPEGSAPDVWSQLAADCERRKDPEAYKAWEEAERKARKPYDLFREMMGHAPAGPKDDNDSLAGSVSAESDDEALREKVPAACRQQ